MVNGSPRNTFRVDLLVGVITGRVPVVTGTIVAGPGTDGLTGGVAVVTIPAGVVFTGRGAGCDDGNNEPGLKTPAGIM